MVKADIKEAYRMVPIYPQDQPLLGIMWQDPLYIDKTSPLACVQHQFFSAIADAIQRILNQKELATSLLRLLYISCERKG